MTKRRKALLDKFQKAWGYRPIDWPTDDLEQLILANYGILPKSPNET